MKWSENIIWRYCDDKILFVGVCCKLDWYFVEIWTWITGIKRTQACHVHSTWIYSNVGDGKKMVTSNLLNLQLLCDKIYYCKLWMMTFDNGYILFRLYRQAKLSIPLLTNVRKISGNCLSLLLDHRRKATIIL